MQLQKFYSTKKIEDKYKRFTNKKKLTKLKV